MLTFLRRAKLRNFAIEIGFPSLAHLDLRMTSQFVSMSVLLLPLAYETLHPFHTLLFRHLIGYWFMTLKVFECADLLVRVLAWFRSGRGVGFIVLLTFLLDDHDTRLLVLD